ncbi:DKNYY domain-containing protein [Flavobacterium ginsenosidimutans]|uniref:DKNYY domain-containing protein n=1 Tax=Flavobacterium ginsenosidimutans TaxID=687844 RepID=UPI003D95C1A9
MKGSKLAELYDANNENALYWTDGKVVYFRENKIKNVDIDSFEQFPGCWAKDKNYCYSGGSKLKDGDSLTFEVLNYAFAKDKNNVWTLEGRIPEADTKTFEVCDTGKKSLGITFVFIENNKKQGKESFVPYGFAKDANNVFYYDFQGKTKVLKKAISSSFKSLNDGDFGYDENSVFYGKNILSKANPKTWKKLHDKYFYSIDQNRVYYFNRLIKDADAESFEIVFVSSIFETPTQYAKDKNHFYLNDTICSSEEFEKYVAETIARNKEAESKIKR